MLRIEFNINLNFILVLPELFKKTSSFDICAKHGSILSLAELIHALRDYYDKNGVVLELEDSILSGLKQLVGNLLKANEFRGFGGELMRKAVCKLIEKLSLSYIDVNDDDVLDDWLHVIEMTIPHTEPSVQVGSIRISKKSIWLSEKNIVLKLFSNIVI